MKKILGLFIALALLIVFILVGKNKLMVFYYNRGEGYYEKNLYKEAVDYFNKALKIDPAVALVHYGLGNAYLGEKLFDQAIEEYKKVIKLDPGFILAYEALAGIYARRRLYQEAMDILKEAQSTLEGNQEVAALISQISSERIYFLLNTSVDAFSNGDKIKAYELLNEALEANPNFTLTYYMLGYLYYIGHEDDQAIGTLREAIRIDNEFFLAYKLLGDIYFEKGIFDKAINEYKKALSINRNDFVVLNDLGLAFMNLENYDEAIPFLKEALSLRPENENIRYSLASVYRDSGRLSEAVWEYKNVISTCPDYPNAYNDLGDIYKKQGRKEDAFRQYRKEIYFCQIKLSNNPEDPFLLASISYAYNGIGDYAKAKKLIDKALKINPNFRQAYLTLASIYRNLGNFTDALAALEKAKSLYSQRYSFIEKDIKDIKALRTFIKRKI